MALLEVVVSLSILLVAMAVIGFTFRNGQHNLDRAELMTRAQLRTEEIITNLDTGALLMTEQEQAGAFGEDTGEGLFYRIFINPSQRIAGMLEIDIEILRGDPIGTDNEPQLILASRILRAEPRGLDFERDFGMDQEQIDTLTSAIPGGAQSLDTGNFNPRDLLASMDIDQLTELLPALIEMLGSKLPQSQLDQLMQAVQSGDLGGLQGAGQGGGIPNLGGATGGSTGGGRGAASGGTTGGGRGASGNQGGGRGAAAGGGATGGGRGATGGGRGAAGGTRGSMGGGQRGGGARGGAMGGRSGQNPQGGRPGTRSR